MRLGVEIPGQSFTPQSTYQPRTRQDWKTPVFPGLGTYVTVPYPTSKYDKNAFYDFVGPLLGDELLPYMDIYAIFSNVL